MNHGDIRFCVYSTIFRLLALVLAAVPAAGAFATSKQVPVMGKIRATYPNGCRDSLPQQSGLCLLTSKRPKAGNQWLIRSKDKSTMGFVDKTITPNTFESLAPGDYFLYSKDGFDSGGFELPFSIAAGSLRTIRTAAFKSLGKGFSIRHFNPTSGNTGSECVMRSLGSKLSDVLPGNYLVYKHDPKREVPSCSLGGVASNAMSGETYQIRARRHVLQKLPKRARYRHPDGISSLTSISQFREQIHEVAIIPKWLSYNGVTNPYPKKHAALILSGMGARTYVIPLTIQKRRVDCGRSLTKGGLSSQPVLTECVFSGDRLQGFRVRSGGSYLTFNNRHGASAIEGNNINNSIAVKGLSVVIE